MSRYGRVSYGFDVPRWGQVQLDHDSKRVEDTVPDSVYVFRAGENNNPNQPPTPDALLMADSWVHTSFVGTRLARLDQLHIENNAQWILNRQLAAEARVQTFTMVNKADYTYELARLRVQAMIKHLYKHVTASDRRRAVESWNQIAPILRVDWTLDGEYFGAIWPAGDGGAVYAHVVARAGLPLYRPGGSGTRATLGKLRADVHGAGHVHRLYYRLQHRD